MIVMVLMYHDEHRTLYRAIRVNSIKLLILQYIKNYEFINYQTFIKINLFSFLDKSGIHNIYNGYGPKEGK